MPVGRASVSRSIPLATDTTGTPAGTSDAKRPNTPRICCVGIDASTRSQPWKASSGSFVHTSPAGSGCPGRYFAFSRRSRIVAICSASRPQSVTERPLSTSSEAITVAIAPLPITATRSNASIGRAYDRRGPHRCGEKAAAVRGCGRVPAAATRGRPRYV